MMSAAVPILKNNNNI